MTRHTENIIRLCVGMSVPVLLFVTFVCWIASA